MSESQSRYSIVERLTQQKLNLIDNKNSLEKELEDLDQTLQQKNKEFESWKVDIKEDVLRAERKQSLELDKIKASLEFKRKQKSSLESSIQNKILEVDKALRSLLILSRLY